MPRTFQPSSSTFKCLDRSISQRCDGNKEGQGNARAQQDRKRLQRRDGRNRDFAVYLIRACTVAVAQERANSPSPPTPGADVYCVDLKDGDTVSGKLKVHFGLKNMGVATAGSDRPNSGHHHLLIDTDLPPLNQPVPNDPHHLHFGAGQTEADVTLSPGEHTLQLLLR
jgi:hypothetical protein